MRGSGPWLNRVVERHRVAVPTARRQSPPGSGWAGGNFGRRQAVEVSCTRGRRQWAAAEPRGSTPSVTAVPTAVRGASKELRSPAGLNRLRQALRRRRLLLHGSTARAGAYLPIESGRRLARSTSSAALPCRAGRRSLMTRMATASVSGPGPTRMHENQYSRSLEIAAGGGSLRNVGVLRTQTAVRGRSTRTGPARAAQSNSFQVCQRHSRTKPENLFRFSTNQTLLRRHCFWKLRHVFCPAHPPSRNTHKLGT